MYDVEAYWFQVIFHGTEATDHWDDPCQPNDRFSGEQLIAIFQDACAASRKIERQTTSLDQLAVGSVRWADSARPSLRWVMTHVIEEEARRNGHADLLREIVDGSVGDRPSNRTRFPSALLPWSTSSGTADGRRTPVGAIRLASACHRVATNPSTLRRSLQVALLRRDVGVAERVSDVGDELDRVWPAGGAYRPRPGAFTAISSGFRQPCFTARLRRRSTPGNCAT